MKEQGLWEWKVICAVDHLLIGVCSQYLTFISVPSINIVHEHRGVWVRYSIQFIVMAAALLSTNPVEAAFAQDDPPAAKAEAAVEALPQVVWPDDMGQRLGRLQQGLACFPLGNFMLADVRLPSEEALRGAIPAHLTGQVQRVRVSICNAFLGIGKGPATQVKLAVLWKDERHSCARLVETSSRVKNSDARWNSQPMMTALSESLREFQKSDAAGAACVTAS